MTSLQSRLKGFQDALVATGASVYHYRKSPRKTAPYLIWAEDGEGDSSFDACNHKAEQSIHGYVDYYTLTEFDSMADTIQETLNTRSEWRLNDVQYEEETNLIHYSWEFTI